MGAGDHDKAAIFGKRLRLRFGEGAKASGRKDLVRGFDDLGPTHVNHERRIGAAEPCDKIRR